ncbi:hypothetical protein EVAR_96700_1 [Eumeta japonica]|uniref:Uncharacterized protein n=1 Tax=Eumeta variegata TaxID=151549 RepID=A0A4C1WK11_EUMVA|nr:hypothetical protein EVAR_96700_1 [Eumeta japonica]
MSKTVLQLKKREKSRKPSGGGSRAARSRRGRPRSPPDYRPPLSPPSRISGAYPLPRGNGPDQAVKCHTVTEYRHAVTVSAVSVDESSGGPLSFPSPHSPFYQPMPPPPRGRRRTGYSCDVRVCMCGGDHLHPSARSLSKML